MHDEAAELSRSRFLHEDLSGESRKPDSELRSRSRAPPSMAHSFLGDGSEKLGREFSKL